MKTLHRHIILSYLGPFILTLSISLFVLVMQFLWLYMDDLVGKGLGPGLLAEIFYYVILTLIPLALPLAILISSIMTFGNLGENYELAALKSSGLSLRDIMQPLVIFTFMISISAFFFSNNVLPYATLKWKTLIWDVTKQKPAITIQEGAFYNGINNYVIRVDHKDPDGKTLHGILIYDHSSNMGNTAVVIAEKGKMELSDDSKYFIITLENGHSYNEMKNEQDDHATHPLVRTTFKNQVMKINVSGFQYSKSDDENFKDAYEVMNLNQIQHEMDTLELEKKERCNSFFHYMNGRVYTKINSEPMVQGTNPGLPIVPVSGKDQRLKNQVAKDKGSKKNVAEKKPEVSPSVLRIQNINRALGLARNAKAETQKCIQDMDNIKGPEYALEIVWHKKFTLSIACLVLFFIGAPLGAIIRKGGLGMPIVVSIFLFIIYYVISITGEKFSKEGVIPPYIGMWISTIVLLPVGIILTRKATNDSSLFNSEAYVRVFMRIAHFILPWWVPAIDKENYELPDTSPKE